MSDQRVEDNTTRATARLPGLDIEIIHRRSVNDEAEQLSINLQAMPSFEAFGRYLETSNLFAFWAQAVQMAWLPGLTSRVLYAAFTEHQPHASRSSARTATEPSPSCTAIFISLLVGPLSFRLAN